MKPMQRWIFPLLMIVCAFAAPLWLAQSHAQSGYPSKPIRLIVSFPPGGSNDIVGRYVGQKLAARLGLHPTKVLERPSAGKVCKTWENSGFS